MCDTFLLTDRMRSAAVKAGGGGGGVCCGGAAWPPCGDGSCDVEATSPTATHVEQERDAASRRAWVASPQRASSDTAQRAGAAPWGDGSWLMSLVLKLFCSPRADDSAPQLRISSVSSSNHRISGMSAGLRKRKSFNYLYKLSIKGTILQTVELAGWASNGSLRCKTIVCRELLQFLWVTALFKAT